MKKLRIYLDTSIVNFLFAEDAPDFRRVTEEFFAVHAQKYELFVVELQTSGECPPRRLDCRREPAGGLLARFAAALAAGSGR